MTGNIRPRCFPSVVFPVTNPPQISYERSWMGLLKSIFNRHSTAAVSRELVAQRVQELTQVEAKVNQVLGMDARYGELLRNCVTDNLKFFKSKIRDTDFEEHRVQWMEETEELLDRLRQNQCSSQELVHETACHILHSTVIKEGLHLLDIQKHMFADYPVAGSEGNNLMQALLNDIHCLYEKFKNQLQGNLAPERVHSIVKKLKYEMHNLELQSGLVVGESESEEVISIY